MDADDPTVDAPAVFVLPPVEEDVPLLLGHLQDGARLGFDSPFLRSGADGLAGELGDGFGVARIGHGAGMPDRCDKFLNGCGTALALPRTRIAVGRDADQAAFELGNGRT